jgi:hypothetical protein
MFARTSRASEEYSLGKFTLGRSIVAEHHAFALPALPSRLRSRFHALGIFAHENL